MISKLEHKNKGTATAIRQVFQASYPYEAALLKATYFPPLKRSLSEFLQTDNTFYGVYIQEELAAVAEIKSTEKTTLIQSLVVHPSYFRQGIGRALVKFVLEHYDTSEFTVETGLGNDPAIQLYKSFGFTKTKVYNTDYGIQKIAFVLKS